MQLKGKYFEYLPNPYYFDVIIDVERINQLPKTNLEKCPGLQELEFENEIPNLNKNLSDGQAEDTNVKCTYSGIVTPLEPKDINAQLNRILQNIIGDEDTVENVMRMGGIGVSELERNSGDPVKELKLCGFFAQAYPTVFINGSCDITIPQLVKIDYEEWVNHIYYCCDNRVSKHPFLKFFLMNLGLRNRALTQGAFVVAQQLNDAHLTIPELRENLENEDESVPRKLISVASKFANSDPYWRDRKIELDNLVMFRKKEFNDLPTYFDTNSLAEFQWTPLRELLIKYESNVRGVSEQVIRDEIVGNFHSYQKMVLSNLHIVTNYFDKRTVNYYRTVGKEIFQSSDIWVRYEFAKGRGEIHSHAIISSALHAKKVSDAMELITSDESGEQNSQPAAKQLYKWLQTTSENENGLFSPSFVSMHPAGGSITHENGAQSWVPNKNLWPKPEGNYEPPNYNPLSENLFAKHTDCPAALEAFHIALTNKVGIHKCNSTCLKFKKKGSKSKICRFHFGKTNIERKESEGKSAHPFFSVVTAGEHPRYEGPRDHPRMISHIKTRLLSWLANCDCQPIIDQDLVALLRYICQYACKGASSTDDFVRLYKHLLNVNNDNTSIRSIAQQLMLKIIGLIDMPAAAVDFLNTGGKLFHCTRKFRRIGLSGYRMLNLNNKNGNATRETPLDQFLSEKRRSKFPEIILYDWAQICNCTKNCGAKHVPVFTGLPMFPVWPLKEAYCKGQLMIYCKGNWRKVEDLKNGHESFEESFTAFLTTAECPKLIVDLVQNAKSTYEKNLLKPNKKTKDGGRQGESEESNSESDSESYNEMRQVREELNVEKCVLDEFSEDRLDCVNPMLELEALPDGGDEFNWHNYAKDCFGGHWPENSADWLENISVIAEEQERIHFSNCNLPTIDLLKANKLQRVIISINILNLMSDFNDQNQTTRLLIQGTAGTGKTFTIVALTYLARRLHKRNSAVINLAPTGAASTLLPDGRTVHSTTSIPRIKSKKDSSTIQMTDAPLNDKSLNKLRAKTGCIIEGQEMKLKLLNIDERGMFSARMLAWCSQRFREATASFDNSFGAIPITNFFGDLGQLGPVCAKELHVEPLSTDPPETLAGYGIYRSFTHCIVLDETMRQGPDQLQFLDTLHKIRGGKIGQEEWMKINGRYEGELTIKEREDFKSQTCLTVMETWAEVNQENHNQLRYLGVPVATLPAKSKGTHAQIMKQVGQIPSVALIAVGSRVMLTKNQMNLTPLGLNNGAIGKVIALLYPEDSGPPAYPEVVVVDFSRYKGPSWIPEHPTWVPIPVDEGRCDTNCCSRTGFPLMPGYCIPIAKCQGATIGPNEPCTHIRIKLQQTNCMEKMSLGLTYTALSRASKIENIAIVEKVPFDRLTSINTHSWMSKRRAEEKRLKHLHEQTLTQYGHFQDFDTYKKLLSAFDALCDDGIHTC